jgi:hypothetical protein
MVGGFTVGWAGPTNSCLFRSLRVNFFSLGELCQMFFRGGEQLVIFDIPETDIRPTGNVGNQLTEPPMRITFAKLRDDV